MFNRTPLSMGMGGMTAIALISLADVRLDVDPEPTPSMRLESATVAGGAVLLTGGTCAFAAGVLTLVLDDGDGKVAPGLRCHNGQDVCKSSISVLAAVELHPSQTGPSGVGRQAPSRNDISKRHVRCVAYPDVQHWTSRPRRQHAHERSGQITGAAGHNDAPEQDSERSQLQR
jgi:hypothetical protein